MKKVFTIMLVLMAIKLNAQITITASNMPSIGDTIRYTTASTGLFNFVKTGANYNWDYSTLGITSQTLDKYQALTSTPYSTLAFTGMPIGAIGVKIADSIGQGQAAFKNIYNFYEKRTSAPSKWNAVGTGFTLSALSLPAGGVYSDKDEIYSFPLNYNDKDSTTFAVKTLLGNFLFSLGYYKQKGYRINTVEGWGTITTPYGNNINCLKIKSYINEIDSLVIPTASLKVGFPNNRVEYKWLSTAEKIPVLEVIGTEIAGVFTPTTIKYRDRFRAVPPSAFGPKVKFTVDKASGKTNKDTFKLTNRTTPAFGTAYTWTITPSAGVSFVRSSNATSTNPSLVFANAGVYTVKCAATNFSGTADSTAVNMITITSTSGLKNIAESSNLAYPNPVQNELHFVNPTLENAVCHVFNAAGQLIKEQLIGNNLTLNCEDLVTGNYTVVINGNNQLYYHSFIKQ
jgi:hypothetical protein